MVEINENVIDKELQNIDNQQEEDQKKQDIVETENIDFDIIKPYIHMLHHAIFSQLKKNQSDEVINSLDNALIDILKLRFPNLLKTLFNSPEFAYIGLIVFALSTAQPIQNNKERNEVLNDVANQDNNTVSNQ